MMGITGLVLRFADHMIMDNIHREHVCLCVFVSIQQTWGEKVLGGGIASLIIPICVMISTSGSSNSGIFSGPRYRMYHAGSCIAGFEIKMFIVRGF